MQEENAAKPSLVERSKKEEERAVFCLLFKREGGESIEGDDHGTPAEGSYDLLRGKSSAEGRHGVCWGGEAIGRLGSWMKCKL